MAFKRCVVCGNLFDARRNAKTCSPEHSRQRVKATPRDWKHDRSQQNKPRARTCVVCGKTFYTTTGTKTCSPEHREEHLRQVRRAAVRRYQTSAKAQETRRRYEHSPERREYRQEYYQSNLYREAGKRRRSAAEARNLGVANAGTERLNVYVVTVCAPGSFRSGCVVAEIRYCLSTQQPDLRYCLQSYA